VKVLCYMYTYLWVDVWMAGCNVIMTVI